ncbi:hypothetical protein [Microbacterium sp. 1P10AE]|uniref:hypothetical protein n=1 Tax=Microbacterium sp. 1P10AE TaxID=3132286 RepID=UPI0039A10DE8
MPAIDVEAVRAKIAERDETRARCAQWCAQALQEFPDAVRAIRTPTRGNPDFLKHVFGRDASTGVWPILRVDNTDNFLIEIGHGAAFTGSGKVWADGKQESVDTVAWWIAARCGYSMSVASTVFEKALMGESWSVRDALRAAGTV